MEKSENKDKAALQSNGKISFGQYAAYGAGGIIPIAIFNSVGILIGMMGNISLGLSAFWLGFILIIPRLWDAISDPFIGHYSDNFRSKWGRRRPFLLWGGILTAIFFVVLWWIPKGEWVQQWFPTESSYQLFQLVYILVSLLLFFTAVNLFEIPHGALGMEMTDDYHVRTQLFSVKSLVGNLFAVITPWLFWLANREYFKGSGGTEMDGMRYVSLLIPALLIPLSFWWFLKLKEPKFVKVKEQKKSDFWVDMKLVVRNKNFIYLTITVFTLAMGFNFVSLLGSYIPIFYIFGGDKDLGSTILGINGTVWAITGMLAVLPLNIISPKLGKRKTLIIAMLLMISAQLSKIVCYNPNHPYLIVIPTILLSAGMLFFFTLGSSMVGDIVDEEELFTGKRTEGSFYAVFWWFIKMGTALASFVAGALIVLTMFDETQVTKVDKIEAGLKDISSLQQKWDEGTPSNADFIQIQTDALKEAQEYEKLLQKEQIKEPEKTYSNLIEYTSSKDSLIKKNLIEVQNVIAQLSKNQINKNEVPTAFIQTKWIKTQMYVFDLKMYLANKLKEPNLKNKTHYEELLDRVNTMWVTLNSDMHNTSVTEMKNGVDELKKEIIPLKKQTPYTLLMMRVVEIGIPILLSLISLFFIFKYSLTEKRSLEIKQLLKSKQ